MTKKEIVQKPFWVIKNVKKNVIWKQVYLSRIEAEQELKQQMSMHPNANGWFIDQCLYYGEKDGLDDFE